MKKKNENEELEIEKLKEENENLCLVSFNELNSLSWRKREENSELGRFSAVKNSKLR